MTKPLKVEVEGFAPFIRKLKAFDDKMPLELKRINLIAAEQVAETAKPLTPFDEERKTGKHLRDTVRAGATQRAALVRAGGVKNPYAAPIHWGWPARGIQPHRFLTDAMAHDEPLIVPEYNAAVRVLKARMGL